MLRSHLISGTIALAILVLSATPLVASDSSRRTAPTTTFVDGNPIPGIPQRNQGLGDQT